MHIRDSLILRACSKDFKTMHDGSTYQECLLTLADMLQLLIWLSDSKQSQEYLLLASIP